MKRISEEEGQLFGIMLLATSLFFDGWLGYEEDEVKVAYNPSPRYLMSSMSLISSLISLACIIHEQIRFINDR